MFSLLFLLQILIKGLHIFGSDATTFEMHFLSFLTTLLSCEAVQCVEIYICNQAALPIRLVVNFGDVKIGVYLKLQAVGEGSTCKLSSSAIFFRCHFVNTTETECVKKSEVCSEVNRDTAL